MMRRVVTLLAGALIALLMLAVGGVIYLRQSGLSARDEPGALETRLARAARRVAVPAAVRDRQNPIAVSPEVLQEAREHFADHCASCHANDGSGATEMGRNLFPKAPDMRLPATQTLSDGELFAIIEDGIRFTGMPGWATGTPEGERSSWMLVHLIRRLPALTATELEDMKARNPRSPIEVRQEIEEERFLNGEPQ